MTFEKRVYQLEFKLNDTDDSIIDYIRENRTSIQNISIHNIADTLFISPNAIMRTAKKLGYSGFSELKFTIQQEEHPLQENKPQSQVLDKIPQNILKSIDVIDDEVVHNLVDDMLKAHNILVLGIGDSVYFCELFGRYLRCLDANVEYYQQIHDMEYAAKRFKEGDLVIVISASGGYERLQKIAQNVRMQGAKTWCITHYGKNKLSDICERQLCFWGEKRVVNGYNVTDRSGLMLLVRMVCEKYWKRALE
ncbi:MAG: MurR/RpiR family transcriptional regulator [Lachnospiraceae bacterium]